MRPEALDALQGSSAIFHAGDIGSESVLHALNDIAPVYAVRGNNDTGEWAAAIPIVARVTIAGISIQVLHDIAELNRTRKTEVVITGHSHLPSIEERDGILFINPGSAGPRRFTLPVSIAKMEIRDQQRAATLIELNVGKSSR
jgi:putative phosphoesterase